MYVWIYISRKSPGSRLNLILALSLSRNATLSEEGPSTESVALRDKERAETGWLRTVLIGSANLKNSRAKN